MVLAGCVYLHLMGVAFIFFFSSRRRHTRSDRDWSSDVCSSDLKVTECGTMACEGPRGGVITATVREHEVILRPVGEGLRCTPQSIAAHSLYENAHPYLHKECSGILDLTHSKYTAIDDVSVRITDSAFIPSSDYTVKLEGAELVGYQSIMIGGIRDPFILRRLDQWVAEVKAYIYGAVARVLKLNPPDWSLTVHVYGRNAVMGALEPNA